MKFPEIKDSERVSFMESRFPIYALANICKRLEYFTDVLFGTFQLPVRSMDSLESFNYVYVRGYGSQ